MLAHGRGRYVLPWTAWHSSGRGFYSHRLHFPLFPIRSAERTLDSRARLGPGSAAITLAGGPAVGRTRPRPTPSMERRHGAWPPPRERIVELRGGDRPVAPAV